MKRMIFALVASVCATGAMAGETPLERLEALTANGTITIAQTCGAGMNVCAPGRYGPGGCYKLGFATCTSGLVCTGGMVACAPSNGSQPYCYKPGYGTCN